MCNELNVPIFGTVKAGTGFGGEFPMAVNCGSREALPQFTDEGQQGCLLGRGAGVFGLAVAVKPSYIADADGMGIVALAVGTGLLDGSAFVDAAIEAHNKMITDVHELAGQVPLTDLLDGDRPTLGRGGTVDYDGIYRAHRSIN